MFLDPLGFEVVPGLLGLRRELPCHVVSCRSCRGKLVVSVVSSRVGRVVSCRVGRVVPCRSCLWFRVVVSFCIFDYVPSRYLSTKVITCIGDVGPDFFMKHHLIISLELWT